MRTPHLSTHKGTPVLIKLRNGTRIEGKFKDKKGRLVLLEDGRKIRTMDIKSFMIWKGVDRN